MNEEFQIKAQVESIISSIIVCACAAKQIELDKSDGDLRSRIRSEVEDLIDALDEDKTAWPKVKDRYLYDIYLRMREEEGTVTEFDYRRPGLTHAAFSEDSEYHKHCVRVSEYRAGNHDTKTCTQCGMSKATHKFSKKGGSICNACRSKSYRQRKAAR